MKKGLCLIGLFSLTILLTGCGNNIVCKGTQTEGDLTVKTTIEANVDKENKIESAKAYIEFNDENKAKDLCELYDQINSKVTNDEDKTDVVCKGKKVTYNDYLKSLGSDSYTKDEFLKKMADIGLQCK